MKPQTILLIRHGESFSNLNLSIHETVPDYKIELTPKGKLQAMEASDLIKALAASDDGRKIAAYISPFKRTRQTFLWMKWAFEKWIVSEHEDPRLREQEYGHFRNLAEQAVIEEQRKAYGTFYFRIPDGESGADVYDRQKAFLETIYRDFEKPDYPSIALIVGHGFQIRTLLMAWLHWTVEEFEAKRNLRNCEMLRLELQSDGKYKLITPLEDSDHN